MSDKAYNFKVIEKKWAKVFSNYSLQNKDLKLAKKYYIIEMLPYPSGKLHMGHIRNYVLGDVLARYKKMRGYAVIHPMGWDSFGMPAENAAIQSGNHPKYWTESNINSMKEQLKSLGYLYDWKREISTHSRQYYSQEQKIFLDMYKNKLIYRKKSYVNWDHVDQTVLANEQVIDGRGWRSGAIVEKKILEQWSVKITDYAEELLQGLKELEGNWPDKVLKMQENWIGKSEGAIINFELIEKNGEIKVYTTRPDTLFGASFIAISADHDFALSLAKDCSELADFLTKCKKISTAEEFITKIEKEGFFTKFHVKHPIIPDQKLPVYIANFVLMEYGTGAIFGCPAHDERDFDFATKYGLPIKQVINPENDFLINSGFLNGININDAKSVMIKYLENNGIGKGQVMYRLRDWLVSRQRYWGCPIPIIHCKSCGEVPAELPVYLPDNIEFDGVGNPLDKHPTWKYVTCPKCKGEALRDTDTLDTFFESSWYFLRYLDPDCSTPVNKEITDIALPVDMCIGGVEHAVLHLLYVRFFMLALRDMGYINSSIPFKKLLTQGMVCHNVFKNVDGEWIYPDEITKSKDGKLLDANNKEVFKYSFEKMSKSKKNVISPQKIADSHGVDAMRLFIISDTPPEKDFDWNTDALGGSLRFLHRIWNVFNSIMNQLHIGDNSLVKTTHVYLKRITNSIENMALNKTAALLREFFNKIEELLYKESQESLEFAFKNFIKAMSLIAPNICHEIWGNMGEQTLLIEASWLEIDEKLASIENITIAVQINGKLRGTFEVEHDSDNTILEALAFKVLGDNLDKSKVKRVIVVKNKIVNIVI
ncbi:MAG: leucine--tRNA ligase [Holosporales bacterium]|jgi:leucyl-tRNA synthetase|nr:leucine--tRNA ligase [Holosporales bacterium]